MIRLNIYAGLGNQMFEYAFARALAEESGDKEIYLNPSFSFFINLYNTPSKLNKRTNCLNHFVLNENVKVMSSFKGTMLGLKDFLKFGFISFIGGVDKKKYKKRSKRGNYIVTYPVSWEYFEHSSFFAKNKRIIGTFLSEKFFYNIKDIIKKEFLVKTEPSEDNKKMIEEISGCNAVCVHIRRGDFLNSKHSSYFNVCNQDYYKKGIEYIAQHTTDPIFYIFSNNSDSINWIKNNYCFDYPVRYIDLNNPDYEELRLMSKCKHFVMSNSSFSWWASYLSDNENKIVVAPEPWRGEEKNIRCRKRNCADAYRDDMIKIPVNLEDKK